MNFPSPGSVLVAAFYLLAALSCWKTADTLVHRSPVLREDRQWKTIALVFVALAVFRLINLQSLLPESGRLAATSEGWYMERRLPQFAFIVALAMAAILVALRLFVRARRGPIPTWLALIGITLFLAYIVIRSVSLHQVDLVINRRAFGLSVNTMLEIGGIALIFLTSEWRRRWWSIGGTS